MKRLYILRHAKAVPADSSAEDSARELTGSGHADGARLGRWLSQNGLQPDLVLCSPARRAVETWQDISLAFDRQPEIRFTPALYLALPGAILAELQKVTTANSVMIVGHNPGLETLALHLVKRPKGEKAKARLRVMAEGFPPCALGIFDFEIERWKDLGAAAGELIDFVRPRDLKA